MSSSIVDVPVFVVLVLGDIIGGFWGEGEIGDWEIRDWEIGRWRAISGGVWRFGVGSLTGHSVGVYSVGGGKCFVIRSRPAVEGGDRLCDPLRGGTGE